MNQVLATWEDSVDSVGNDTLKSSDSSLCYIIHTRRI